MKEPTFKVKIDFYARDFRHVVLELPESLRAYDEIEREDYVLQILAEAIKIPLGPRCLACQSARRFGTERNRGVCHCEIQILTAKYYYDKPEGDSAALHSISHPQMTPLWKRILQFFRRPKFSSDNLDTL